MCKENDNSSRNIKNGNNNDDDDIPAQVVLLQNDTLATIRLGGIPLVLSIAALSFTKSGKGFSIFALFISLAFFIIAVINYFIKRNQFADKGYYPTLMTDLIIVVTIFVIVLNIWMLYEVFQTESTNLGEIASDIQRQVETANKVNSQIIQSNLEAIRENRRLITKASEALGFPADEVSSSNISSPNTQEGKGATSNILGSDIENRMQQAIYAHDIIDQSLKTTHQLKNLGRDKGIQTGAVLAAVA